MCTKALRKWALLLTFWVAIQLSPVRAGDQTVSGNLTVTGTTDLQGTTLTLGTRSDNLATGCGRSSIPMGTTATLLSSMPAANTTTGCGSRTGARRSLALSNVIEQRECSYALTTIRSQRLLAAITLNPSGTSTFSNSGHAQAALITQMPNQTLTGANSVLTEGLSG